MASIGCRHNYSRQDFVPTGQWLRIFRRFTLNFRRERPTRRLWGRRESAESRRSRSRWTAENHLGAGRLGPCAPDDVRGA
jgi:hypothetical protein